MTWTQPQCVECWKLENGERLPRRLKDPEREICCTCGKETISGIYVRKDPKSVPYPRKEDE